MTFDVYIDKHYLKIDVMQRRKINFTLDDMQACWKASESNTRTKICNAIQSWNDKIDFEHLSHRSEDEQV